MRYLVLLFSLTFASSSFAVTNLDCENNVAKLKDHAVLKRASDRAASRYADFGKSVKAGDVFNAYKIQSCSTKNGRFEAVTTHYKVPAKKPGALVKFYNCESKFKRIKSANKWRKWAHVATACKAARFQAVEQSPSLDWDVGQDPHLDCAKYYPIGFDPQDCVDPLYTSRTPNYGPDSAYDDWADDSHVGSSSDSRTGENLGDEWH